MKTLEEKEKEFKEYVYSMIVSLVSAYSPQEIQSTQTGSSETSLKIRTLAHNLIQDFKEEIEGFNLAMSEELEKTKEELERYKEAFEVYYKALHGDHYER